jgi:hypothetical protein
MGKGVGRKEYHPWNLASMGLYVLVRSQGEPSVVEYRYIVCQGQREDPPEEKSEVSGQQV